MSWESEIQNFWEKEGVYWYQDTSSAPLFVIDTPPPTVSGSLHIGHVFSYVQTDVIARFQRMNGKNVFYPMGWDNNGLPTEKRVQKVWNVVCDPSVSDQPLLGKSLSDHLLSTSSSKKNKKLVSISRRDFIKLCQSQTKEDQKKYEELWRRSALSVDWRETYETISLSSQLISQKSFLDLYRKGFVENRFSPVFWDTQFQTAIAQADIEDRLKKGFYYDIKFQIEETKNKNLHFVISTTRPELLPACVAVAAHPNDDRYKKYFGKNAITPLFNNSVPIIPSTHADPKKGTGILMICTYGDKDDVDFWKKYNRENPNTPLPLKAIIGPNGKLKPLVFSNSLNSKLANQFYAQILGLYVSQARKKIIELLQSQKALIREPKPTEHHVKFYEKGELPLELIPTHQWYIKILEHKEALIKRGREVNWHPPSMLKRYEQWVEGLNQDWCISRQRFFGVPFPTWYPLDKNKKPDYTNPIMPFLDSSPLDPSLSAPFDYWNKNKNPQNNHLKKWEETLRNQPDGFCADCSVMDTWATSSLTPQINSHYPARRVAGSPKEGAHTTEGVAPARWVAGSPKEGAHTTEGVVPARRVADPTLPVATPPFESRQKLFPADLRPQAHEIIRTWAFYTIVKSHFHEQSIPWKHIAISGWVMNPDRLKMSKSKGNVQEPQKLMELYGVDSVRYWAGRSRLGQDTVYDENTVKQGRRLSIKLSNAFRFVAMQTEEVSLLADIYKNSITSWVDQSWIHYLYTMHQLATKSLNHFDHSHALEVIEKAFWVFCDNYLELVKTRAYQLKNTKFGRSVACSLDFSLYIFIKMFAPFIPYVTEKLWLKRYQSECVSVHKANWNLPPIEDILPLDNKNLYNFKKLFDLTFQLLEQARAKKTACKKSLSTPVSELKVRLNETQKKAWRLSQDDLCRAVQVDLKNVKIEWVNSTQQSKATNQSKEDLPQVLSLIF